MSGFKNRVDDMVDNMLASHLLFINCHYGYNKIELINAKRKEMEREERTLIIYHGEKDFKDLIEEYENDCMTLVDFIDYPNMEKSIIIADAYGELISMIDGEIMLSDIISELGPNTFDSIIIMNVNYMFMGLLDIISMHFINAPVLCIGDSEAMVTDTAVLKALNNTRYFFNDVYRMRGYNAEILYFIKKLRTGVINRLERSTTRDMMINKVQTEEDFYNSDEVMDYSVVIDTTGRFREYNIALRNSIGFDFMPNINEPMVNITPFIATSNNGKRVVVDAYNIFKVKSISTENGILRATFEHREQEIEIPLNTHYLSKVTESDIPLDIAPHEAGVKMEFAYFIPPRVAVNKAFPDVLIYFQNRESIYARKLLISMLSSCVRSFKIKTDYEYYL